MRHYYSSLFIHAETRTGAHTHQYTCTVTCTLLPRAPAQILAENFNSSLLQLSSKHLKISSRSPAGSLLSRKVIIYRHFFLKQPPWGLLTHWKLLFYNMKLAQLERQQPSLWFLCFCKLVTVFNLSQHRKNEHDLPCWISYKYVSGDTSRHLKNNPCNNSQNHTPTHHNNSLGQMYSSHTDWQSKHELKECPWMTVWIITHRHKCMKTLIYMKHLNLIKVSLKPT